MTDSKTEAEPRPCIACGYHVTYPLFHPDNQPMAALVLPKSEDEAHSLPTYPMDFHTCGRCGHIYNVQFSYADVPYDDSANLMYNAGSGWAVFLEALIERLKKSYNLENTTWVEIGCGDGHFLERLKKHVPSVKLIGFEPSSESAVAAEKGIEVHRAYFDPKIHLKEIKPDFLVCRHVIEHLEDPRHFVSDISYWSNMHGVFPTFIAEVPRINKAVSQARINDYLYEHVSNFTDRSFQMMFEMADFDVLNIEDGYAGEVLVADVRAKKQPELAVIKATHEGYKTKIDSQLLDVSLKISNLSASGKTVAFWGGTGKGASFLNNYRVESGDFPLVIDSDHKKCGRHVPGMGQRLQPPEYLEQNPSDYIVITTQWRAKDIYEEIQRRGITHETVYVLIEQELVAYHGEEI